MSDPRPLLYRSLDQAAHVVRGVSDDQLTLPTPCREFDVSALMTHIVGVGKRVAAIGRGEPQTARLPVPNGVGELGWAAAFDEARRQAVAAWADELVLDRKVELPFGTFDGATVASIYTMELTAHSWDLARATAQVDALDEELAQVSLVFAESALPPDSRDESVPFEPVVTVAPGAPTYDRLAGYLGRRVD